MYTAGILYRCTGLIQVDQYQYHSTIIALYHSASASYCMMYDTYHVRPQKGTGISMLITVFPMQLNHTRRYSTFKKGLGCQARCRSMVEAQRSVIKYII